MVLPRGRGSFVLPAPVPGGLFKFQARLCPGRLAAFLGAQGVEVAEPRAADAAHDVHEVGDIVMHEDDIVHLLAQIQRGHQQHRDRDAARKAGQRRQHDEHEHDAGSAQQGRAGEERALQHPIRLGQPMRLLQGIICVSSSKSLGISRVTSVSMRLLSGVCLSLSIFMQRLAMSWEKI